MEGARLGTAYVPIRQRLRCRLDTYFVNIELIRMISDDSLLTTVPARNTREPEPRLF